MRGRVRAKKERERERDKREGEYAGGGAHVHTIGAQRHVADPDDRVGADSLAVDVHAAVGDKVVHRGRGLRQRRAAGRSVAHLPDNPLSLAGQLGRVELDDLEIGALREEQRGDLGWRGPVAQMDEPVGRVKPRLYPVVAEGARARRAGRWRT